MDSLKDRDRCLDRRDWDFFRSLVRFSLGLEEAGKARALAEGVEGRGLVSLAGREGISSFLLWGIQETGSGPSLPSGFMETLQQRASLERDHLVRVYLVAVQSLGILEELEVPSLVVKGLALAPYWPVSTHRFMSDVDLVVPWEDRRTIWAHYEGFRRIQRELGVTAEVEPLHHDLTAGNTIPLDFEEIFARSRPGRVGGVEARVPSSLDLALGAASSALRHDPRALRVLLDLAFLVRSGEMDMDALAEEGRKLGLGRILRFLFLQLQARFGLNADERILSLARGGGLEWRLGLWNERAVPRSSWFAGPGLYRAWLKIRLERPLGFLKRSLINFFPPPLALRNQFIREGRQKDFLPFLYLEHWRRRLSSLVPRRAWD